VSLLGEASLLEEESAPLAALMLATTTVLAVALASASVCQPAEALACG
jgi:hypothetical protein